MVAFNTGNPAIDAKLEMDVAVKSVTKKMADVFLIRCFIADNYPDLVKSEIRDVDNKYFFPNGIEGSNIKIKKTGNNLYHVKVGERWGIYSIDEGKVLERCGTLACFESK